MKKIIRSAERICGSKTDDLRSEVYNALSDIMYRFDASQEDMDDAIDWFNAHFYIDEPYKEED